MNVELLQAAIDKVRNRRLEPDSREATYLRTYPALLAMACCEREAFNQAYQERLDWLEIARYRLTEIRL
jgi:hypothetical protein